MLVESTSSANKQASFGLIRPGDLAAYRGVLALKWQNVLDLPVAIVFDFPAVFSHYP